MVNIAHGFPNNKNNNSVTAQVRDLRLRAGNLYPYRIISHTPMVTWTDHPLGYADGAFEG